jgi:hypothetical protein
MLDEKHLDVAHVWQLDPDSPIPENQRRRMCGPASVNMVLDYVFARHGDYSFDLAQIVKEMEGFGGRIVEYGWKHSALVSTLKHHGLVAWRRNWLAPSQDPSYFVDNEDYDEVQVSTFLSQLEDEDSHGESPKDRAWHCIKDSLDRGLPVIVSVKPGFSENEIGHFVVVSGYTGASIEVVDPLLPPGEQKNVTREYFWEYFKLQAIFVKAKY